MNKTIIAAYGVGDFGKSSSVKCSYKKMDTIEYLENERYNANTDFRTILHLTGLDVKIGIESQGESKYRMCKIIDVFVSKNCDIIITACRFKGDAMRMTFELSNKDGYDIIWAQNIILENKKHNLDLINDIFSDSILRNVQELIHGKF